ncbi:MAG: HAD hydrolase-like protein [Planctomycetota bacterium]
MAAPAPDFPFDAVLFDLDGTLVATDRFWPDAARAACLEAFPRLGITRPIPPASVWMDMVGLPLDAAFEAAFSDLAPVTRQALMETCVEHEHRWLARGEVALLPGVAATLNTLAAAGVRLGIASNCGQDYLRLMLERVGLARWIEEARCLASPRVRTKSDMVEDLLLTFGTRSAVMVGDRRGDRDAAWDNGLPHVHVDRGYAAAPERVEAEAILDGMDQLVDRLRCREAWLDGMLRSFTAARGAVLGVTGRPLAGKGLVARDLARRLCAKGTRAVVVSLDAFACEPGGAASDDLEGYDVASLVAAVLQPHRRGEGVAHLQPQAGGERAITVPTDAVLILEGSFLGHPDLRDQIDHLVHLAASDELSLRRAAGRDGRLRGVAPIDEVRRGRLPAHAAFEARYPPRTTADLIVIADNPLGDTRARMG